MAMELFSERPMVVAPGFNSNSAPIAPFSMSTSLAIYAKHQHYHPWFLYQVNSRRAGVSPDN
jgi:hypothetical protein